MQRQQLGSESAGSAAGGSRGSVGASAITRPPCPAPPPFDIGPRRLAGLRRNDVDSEETGGSAGTRRVRLTTDPELADAVVVNTADSWSAKKDSIDTLLAATEPQRDRRAQAVVAVGCLASGTAANSPTRCRMADAGAGSTTTRRWRPGSDRSWPASLSQPTRPGTDGPVAVGPRQRDRPPGAATRNIRIADLPAGLAPASGPPLRRRPERRTVGAAQAGVRLRSGGELLCNPASAVPTCPALPPSRGRSRWLAEQGVGRCCW